MLGNHLQIVTVGVGPSSRGVQLHYARVVWALTGRDGILNAVALTSARVNSAETCSPGR
ncbi:MAG: hypothetical protein KGJ62_14270 [Armatimonadetes bacterium]|nr:hypothetical protein [Armatimonadota bacterium]MDE2207073.1 hypothetical protein [Armatimonadota bacterium]